MISKLLNVVRNENRFHYPLTLFCLRNANSICKSFVHYFLSPGKEGTRLADSISFFEKALIRQELD